MMKNALTWIVAVVMVSGGTVAHAQSMSAPRGGALTTTATPLRDSAQRAVIALAKTPIASQPTTPHSTGKACAKGLVIGTGVGAAIGFGSALGLLMGTGGSDSAAEILKGFTLYGGVAGLMIGGVIGCR